MIRTAASRSQAGTRFSFVVIGVLASVAALLAAAGIYGVLSTNVRQRTVEIGVRLAVGATPSSVFGLIVRQGLVLSAAGIAIGLAAALGLAQTIDRSLRMHRGWRDKVVRVDLPLTLREIGPSGRKCTL